MNVALDRRQYDFSLRLDHLPGRSHCDFLGFHEGRQAVSYTHLVTPAAIGNAIFDATGARLRELPFTAERVKAALLAHRAERA